MAQTKTQFGYRRHPDQDRVGTNLAEHAVVVVGAGPVGLSLAIDLAQRGQSVVLLDDADRIGEGSRAIMFSKRSLEFWDRLGVGDRMVEKGVVCPKGATRGRPSSTSSNSTLKPIWWIAHGNSPRSTCAGATR